jgi:hypothetical protein
MRRKRAGKTSAPDEIFSRRRSSLSRKRRLVGQAILAALAFPTSAVVLAAETGPIKIGLIPPMTGRSASTGRAISMPR